MNHQQIALWIWAAVAAMIVISFLGLLASFFGRKAVMELVVGILLARVAPVALVIYTVWAFAQ